MIDDKLTVETTFNEKFFAEVSRGPDVSRGSFFKKRPPWLPEAKCVD
jgi:hypothetical protein